MALSTDDVIEIQQLVARYNHAVDSGDADAFCAAFTTDGVLDAAGMVIEGHDALGAFAKGVPGSFDSPRHIASNVVVEGDGDRASLRAYVQMYARQGDPPHQVVVASGRYHDELVKSGGAWRFRRRFFESD